MNRWPEPRSTGKLLRSDRVEGSARIGVAVSPAPKHTAAAVARKHRNLSHVEQHGSAPMPKDRGAEQGDVGPLGVQPGFGDGGG